MRTTKPVQKPKTKTQKPKTKTQKPKTKTTSKKLKGGEYYNDVEELNKLRKEMAELEERLEYLRSIERVILDTITTKQARGEFTGY